MMRRAILIAVIVVAALAAFKAVLMVSRPREGDLLRGQWHYIDQERAQILASKIDPHAVVLFGDSQIANSGFESLGFANYGIGGETATGLASRIPAYDLSQTQTAILEVGINDWWHGGLAGFRQSYGDVLAALPPRLGVIAIGILPFNAKAGRYFPLEGAKAAVRQANADIAAACRRRANCEFLDPTAALGGADGLGARFDNGDGLHLSPAGYGVLLERLRPLLARPSRSR